MRGAEAERPLVGGVPVRNYSDAPRARVPATHHNRLSRIRVQHRAQSPPSNAVWVSIVIPRIVAWTSPMRRQVIVAVAPGQRPTAKRMEQGHTTRELSRWPTPDTPPNAKRKRKPRGTDIES